MNRLDGTPEPLAAYEGKVLLVVNTASECGYTPQYDGLEALHEKYAARGFAVLGFPSNDFGGQEPGSSTEIATFCRSKYGVRFPMFAKVETTGPGRTALYALLGTKLGEPKWNFHKYPRRQARRAVEGVPQRHRPRRPGARERDRGRARGAVRRLLRARELGREACEQAFFALAQRRIERVRG